MNRIRAFLRRLGRGYTAGDMASQYDAGFRAGSRFSPEDYLERVDAAAAALATSYNIWPADARRFAKIVLSSAFREPPK